MSDNTAAVLIAATVWLVVMAVVLVAIWVTRKEET